MIKSSFQSVLIHSTGLILLLILMGCKKQDSQRPDTKPEITLRPIATTESSSAIENLIQVGPRLYSGGEPKTREAFEQIANLGCKTIVSVDGAKPNLKLAREFGLSYVHIPVGYDGLSQDAQWSIVNAIRSHQGPIFFHCHHGKHRGPAAAAIGLMADTNCDPSTARKLLELGGTSPDYKGLWKDVAEYKAPPADARLPQLSETAEVDSFVAAMSSLDRAFDELKLCRDAEWEAPSDHPDLVPLSLATLIREGFAESKRMAKQDSSKELLSWLSESEIHASQLEQSLRENDTLKANAAFGSLANGCLQCHKKYRN
jgi:protein tyrosine phosphatase (PTP) superfamily phosphohydrolase (DUF442 family)